MAEGIPTAIKAEVVGDELRLTGLLLSEMEGITVIDAAGKFAPPVSVKVIPGTGSIRVSPNVSTVSETDNQNLNFTVLGAVAGENFASSALTPACSSHGLTLRAPPKPASPALAPRHL